MKKKIFELLNGFGVPFAVKGREYIESAIGILTSEGKIQITKELYPRIAKEHGTTAQKAERAIRHALSASNKDKIKNLFGKEKISNREFLCGMAKYIEIYVEETQDETN